MRRDLDQAHSMWEARVDGLKASLQATEQHARALEQQLAMRPTNQMVSHTHTHTHTHTHGHTAGRKQARCNAHATHTHTHTERERVNCV